MLNSKPPFYLLLLLPEWIVTFIFMTLVPSLGSFSKPGQSQDHWPRWYHFQRPKARDEPEDVDVNETPTPPRPHARQQPLSDTLTHHSPPNPQQDATMMRKVIGVSSLFPIGLHKRFTFVKPGRGGGKLN